MSTHSACLPPAHQGWLLQIALCSALPLPLEQARGQQLLVGINNRLQLQFEMLDQDCWEKLTAGPEPDKRPGPGKGNVWNTESGRPSQGDPTKTPRRGSEAKETSWPGALTARERRA